MTFEDFETGFYDVLTPQDMRATEEMAFALGVPSLILMEHAAEAVVDALKKELGGCCKGKRVLFLCGTGNNGGDGLAAARLFLAQGGRPEIWLSGNPKTPDAKTNLRWAQALEIPMLNLRETPEEPASCGGYDGYVDALLGTGLKDKPDELTARMILKPFRDFPPGTEGDAPPVIAVDIPSGMDGKTGAIPGACVRADVTVTFHAPKPGLYLTRARSSVGRIVVADIGLWRMRQSEALTLGSPELRCATLSPAWLRALGRRPLNAHKGDCGRILIYAGSKGMAGAAAMCAKAAIAAGAGLTTIACPKKIMPVLQMLVPNAMCVDIEKAVENPPAFDALAVGPGLGQSKEIWKNILQLFDPKKPSVWDADALNLLSRHPMKLGDRAYMTPHPGEAARLLDWSMKKVLADRLETARALSEKYGCIAALKSDVTVICAPDEKGPRYMLNTVGTPALAKGGSGDVLTGILSVCAREWHMAGLQAAALACLWHGMAGVIGEKEFGQRELNAGQLIDCLHAAEQWALAAGAGPHCPEDSLKNLSFHQPPRGV